MTTPSYAVRLASGVIGTPNIGASSIVALSDLLVGTPNHGPLSLTVDPQAADWYTRVKANGGTASINSILSVSNFISELRTFGLFSKIVRMNALCGDGILSALVPVIKNSGGSVDVNVNFVGGDYSESTSFVGNGTTKYIKTGLVPTGLVGGIFCYCITNDFTVMGCPIGSRDASQTDIYRIYSQTGPVVTGAWGGTSGSNTSTPGFMTLGGWHVERVGSTNSKLFLNGSLKSTRVLPTTPLGTAPELYVYAQNAGGTANLFCDSNSHIGGYAIDDGTMSEADALKYSGAWSRLMVALGRTI